MRGLHVHYTYALHGDGAVAVAVDVAAGVPTGHEDARDGWRCGRGDASGGEAARLRPRRRVYEAVGVDVGA